MRLRLADFNYHLPKNLIAQQPAKPRDQSRLLVLDKTTGKIQHRHFYNLLDYLKPGDVLVLNNTKVRRARLIGSKAETGGKIEVFLLNELGNRIWQCLIGAKRRKENLKINFKAGLKAEILKNNHDGTWQVKFNKSGEEFRKIIEKIGKVPLPPYIKRKKDSIAEFIRPSGGLQNDKNNYQTVYADNNKPGSAAAPTAGLHFTKKLIYRLKKKGVQIEYVTLQVGFGTFAPVKFEDITKHQMHAEWAEVRKKTIENIFKAKQEGRRIIVVGTTSVRALESVFKNYSNYCHCEERKRRSNLTYSALDQRLLRRPEHGVSRNDRNCFGWTDIFIYPGYEFKIIDALITNFHLPKSTLLMLVSAFAKARADKSVLSGRDKIFKAYKSAIRKKYRFYSFGDAMLIV